MRNLLILLTLVLAHPGQAGPAEVIQATAERAGEGWRITVTLRHGDTGWDHYADGWSVELADGQVLGHRTLFHPHVEEQPFTRSLAGVTLTAGTRQIFIRAHDTVHGWSEVRFAVPVPSVD